MANTIRIKRRAAGDGVGAPSSLANAELAFNEASNILYYGTGTGGANGTATQVIAIGGSGSMVTLGTTQTVSGEKTFSGAVTFSGSSVSLPSNTTGTTQSANDNSTKIATTAYVDGAISAVSGTITFAGDTGTSQQVSLTETITIAGGTGINTVAGATDTITVSIDDSVVATRTWVGNQAYLTSESDPVFAASEAYNITSTDTSNWTAAYNWGNHANAGYLTTETEPAFTGSEAYNISSTDTSNWNTAYGWGDHATQGYAVGQNVGTSDTVTFASITTSGNVTIGGDLTVNGTVTSVNSTTVTVDDKNLELGSTASPSDATANNGGITLKGSTDKTFNWIDATDAWTSSEHMDLASGKAYYINGTSVLSGNTLGSGVTSSSLTSVGTIGTGTWQGTAVAIAYGGTGSTTASGARENLGVKIGTDVQAYSSALQDISNGNWIGASTITTVGTIGTGTWQGTAVGVSYGGTGATSASGARSNLGLVIGTDVQAYNATLAAVAGGSYTGASSITTLGTIATGTWNGSTVAVSYGGTGATTASGARNNLGVAIGSDVQAYSSVLADVAAGNYTLDGGTF